MGCAKSGCDSKLCCLECDELDECRYSCDDIDRFEFAEECRHYVKPCPFCGEIPDIERKGSEIGSGGVFCATYELRCDICDISFGDTSEFTVDGGVPVIRYDGYQKLIDHWNRKKTEEK